MNYIEENQKETHRLKRIPSGQCVNAERAVGSSILEILHYLFQRRSANVQNETFKPFLV
jgi:hypothetical protein